MHSRKRPREKVEHCKWSTREIQIKRGPERRDKKAEVTREEETKGKSKNYKR